MQLLGAGQKLRELRTAPPNIDDTSLWRMRSASLLVPAEAIWAGESMAARDADAGVPVAAVPLIAG